jgi:hypothetical protein
MSYQRHRPGPFVLSKLTAPHTYSNTTEFTLNLDAHYTSSGLMPYSPTENGLVFSDITTEKTGTFIVGMHKPTTGGKYGGDEPQAMPGRSNSGSLGCGIYSNETPKIYYKSSYEANDTVTSDTYVVVW